MRPADVAAMTTDSLSIYAVQRTVGGQRIQDFDDVIEPDRLGTVEETRDFQNSQNIGPLWSARMYLWYGEARRPSWVEFLEEGFGGGRIEVPDSVQSCAVVVVKIFFRLERLYAIPFGLSGRFQIRRDVIGPRYGLRVALNLLYEGDGDANELTAVPGIQQVESKTVAVNTMRTIRQANRHTDFEEFELDPDTDQLAGVTGQPRDANWARRVRGADSLRVARPRISFNQLGDLCRHVARVHERSDYRRRFRFVDRYQGITDPSEVTELIDLLRASLRGDPSAWAFAIPGVQDYDRIASVRITAPIGEGEELVDPTTSDIAQLVGVDDLVEHLPKVRIETIDGDGEVIDQWSMLECLDGQLVTGDRTVLFEAGTFYEIEPDYLAQLNHDVDDLPHSMVALPPSVRVLVDGRLKEIEEGPYNEQAAAPDDHFLLDKQTVNVPGRTDPIEVCDVLTLGRQLVHAKRKFSSSSLSHLFGQGYVSSELLVDSEPYRAAIRTRIGDANADFQDLFPAGGIVPADWEVVYAIIGPWDGGTTSAKLPFFSKINLRNHTRRLRLLGFRITIAHVPVIDP
jgi:uncharacterized protein (TIGR04141 family)